MDVFEAQYKNMRFRAESTAVTKIDLYFYDEFMTSGTGFVYRFGTDLYLVTNWHVFSGIHPVTRVVRSARGITPNIAKFHVSVFDAEEGSMNFKGIEMEIRSGAELKWLEHDGYTDDNDNTMIVDVAVLSLHGCCPEFDDIKDQIAAFPAQVVIEDEFVEGSDADGVPKEGIGHAYPKVSSQVFILGYPKGIPTQGVIPIWKSGFVSSEPLFGAIDGAPIILIDALTRDGMSGSPVINFGDDLITAGGQVMTNNRRDDDPWLVGVYAGREGVTGSEIDMALGRAWRKETIDQIIMQEHERQRQRDEE